jgi:hypothetical protein
MDSKRVKYTDKEIQTDQDRDTKRQADRARSLAQNLLEQEQVEVKVAFLEQTFY